MRQGLVIAALVIAAAWYIHSQNERIRELEAENAVMDIEIERRNKQAEIDRSRKEYEDGLGEGGDLSDYLRDGALGLWPTR